MHEPAGGIDVVVPLGSGSTWDDNEELRYALRALERNFLDLRRVYVVGIRPGWLSDAAVHVPADDRYGTNKDGNIIHKLLLACGQPDMSAQLVRASDDEVFLRPIRYSEMRAYYRGDLRRVRGSPAPLWRRRLRETGRYLAHRQLPTRFYDCHAPVPIDRGRFSALVRGTSFGRGRGLTVDSLYFNLDDQAPRAPLHGQVLHLERPATSRSDLEARLASAQYLNYRDSSLDAALKGYLTSTFDRPSRFER
jgi:hypothetical protein